MHGLDKYIQVIIIHARKNRYSIIVFGDFTFKMLKIVNKIYIKFASL